MSIKCTKKRTLILFLSLGLMLSSHAAMAMETDNFNSFNSQIEDSSEIINHKTNDMIEESILEANQILVSKKIDCEITKSKPPLIYKILKRKLGHNPVALIEDFAEYNNEVLGVQVKKKDSIYKGAGILNGPILYAIELSKTININDVHFGTDKLGHALAQGYSMFEKHMWEGNSLEDVLEYSKRLELGFYGGYTTAVISYADMAANFSGMQIWRDLLYGEKPMIICQNDRYKQIRKFVWENYVNDSWNEAINCSDFTMGLGKIVEKNLKEKTFVCPMKKVNFSELPCGHYYLNKIFHSSKNDYCPNNIFDIPENVTIVKNIKNRNINSSDKNSPTKKINSKAFVWEEPFYFRAYDALVTLLQEFFGRK